MVVDLIFQRLNEIYFLHFSPSDDVVYSLCSVDQFLECFDGLRSSQNDLASSRILSWTCSIFNAITAASNLASGSYYVPPGLFFLLNDIIYS